MQPHCNRKGAKGAEDAERATRPLRSFASLRFPVRVRRRRPRGAALERGREGVGGAAVAPARLHPDPMVLTPVADAQTIYAPAWPGFAVTPVAPGLVVRLALASGALGRQPTGSPDTYSIPNKLRKCKRNPPLSPRNPAYQAGSAKWRARAAASAF